MREDGTKGTEGSKFPPYWEIKPAIPAMLTGTVVGTLVGAIPGAGATPAAMISYQAAQVLSKKPEEFGKGSIEGIGANEAAQNASNSGELIPTLGLGIPVSGSMVLLLAALTVQGFVPGPLMVANAPELLFAAIAGLLAASLLLLATGWGMARVMLKAVQLNRQIDPVLSLAMIVVGVYAMNTKAFDIVIAMLAGSIGYAMLHYGYSAAAALGVFLGREFERSLRIGLNMNDNSYTQFFGRPITMVIVLAALALLIFGLRKQAQTRRACAKPMPRGRMIREQRADMKQVEVAVIGTGWCGGDPAQTLSQSALVDRLHICEIRPDRLKEVRALTVPRRPRWTIRTSWGTRRSRSSTSRPHPSRPTTRSHATA